MRQKETIAQVAKRWYEQLRKPMIVIAVITAFSAGIYDIPIAQSAALLAAALLLVELLFDISDRLTIAKRGVRFLRIHDAALHFREAVEKRAVSGKLVSVKWLGMSMEYGSSLLDDMVSSLKNVHKHLRIQLTIVMLDPDWEHLKDINTSWPMKAQAHLENIKLLVDRLATEFPEQNITVNVYLYSHMPNWHGFVLDDRYGYISTCSWHGKRLLGGENPYELIDGQQDDINAEKLYQFLSWFDYCKQRQVKG